MSKPKSDTLVFSKASTIVAIAYFLIGLLIFLSLATFRNFEVHSNCLGLFGYGSAWLLEYSFGLSSFMLPFFFLFLGMHCIKNNSCVFPRLQTFYFILFFLSISILLTLVTENFPRFSQLFYRWIFSGYYPTYAYCDAENLRYYLGGVLVHQIYADIPYINLKKLIGPIGTTIIFSTAAALTLLLLINHGFLNFWKKCMFYSKKISNQFKHTKKEPKLKNLEELREPAEPDFILLPKAVPLTIAPKINFNNPSPLPATTKTEKIGDYTLPPSSLLTQVKLPDLSMMRSDLQKSAAILEETFVSFGIEAKVGEIHPGPTITLFEVHPAIGVKVQKIKALENDIALNMQAKSIRIIAPIPGKAVVGIEVPNLHPQEVSFRSLLEHYRNSGKGSHIPLLLGKVVNGDDMWTDLTKMPHLIIAGATGSGKSVCINTIVMSIVMNARPDEIKLVMVDPKKVELTSYSTLPHMLAPVITEAQGAATALNWLVHEMEKRYEILRRLSIRNIHGFNQRKIDKKKEENLGIDIPEKMTYIVVIIDELADLMMISASDIETPIARIAQMARAVGIHLILATQRPSREVITGIIKANFPSRIAFKVSSRVNSQIIIDENGAEMLLGNGDMLFMPPGSSALMRAQGAFIRDEDINKVIEFIKEQAPTNYLIPSFDNFHDPLLLMQTEECQKDPLFEEAKSLVYETGNASTTFMQRKLKVGYARAASIMDQLELSGIIGPSEGAKPRKIYHPQEDKEDA